MRRVVSVAVLVAMFVAVVAACGGATNQTITPGQGTSTQVASAAPLPSASPTPSSPGGGGSGSGGGSTAEGKQVYAANCAGCHGATGTGGFGPNLVALKPPLSRVQTQVTNGGAQMPAFKGQLTPAQIDAVSTFVAGGFKD